MERRSSGAGRSEEGKGQWRGGGREGDGGRVEARSGRRAPLLPQQKVMRNKGPGVNTEPLILKVRRVMSEGKTAAKEEEKMKKKRVGGG